MTILLLGAKGMLGTDVAAALQSRHSLEHREPGVGGDGRVNLIAFDLEDFDISNPEHSARIIAREFGKIDWIINCAAYTAVDRAESEPEVAYAVNGLGPSYLAKAASAAGARLIHISTDFVFDGTKTTPYETTDTTNPLSVYGKSKLMGEEGVFAGSQDSIVIRTSWLFGSNGNSFPKTMIRAYEAGKQLRVVADQMGCPTYTGDLASAILSAIERNIPGGIYHFCGPEAMSWHEFACTVIQAWIAQKGTGEMPVIEAIQTEDWPTPATRPKYSVLSRTKIVSNLDLPVKPLSSSLREALTQLSV